MEQTPKKRSDDIRIVPCALVESLARGRQQTPDPRVRLQEIVLRSLRLRGRDFALGPRHELIVPCATDTLGFLIGADVPAGANDAPMTGRARCMFCFMENGDNITLSKEHLLSKPVAKAFGVDRSSPLLRTDSDLTEFDWRHLDGIKFGCVCTGCNNGWMNRLEPALGASPSGLEATKTSPSDQSSTSSCAGGRSNRTCCCASLMGCRTVR